MPCNLCSNRIRNPGTEESFLRRRNLRERHDFVPDFLRRRVDFDRAFHLEQAGLRPQEMFDSIKPWCQQHRHGQNRRSISPPPVRRLNDIAQAPAQQRQNQRQRSSHQNADDSFDRYEQKNCS